MWVPRSLDELRRAVRDGLEESPWLDAKADLGAAAEAAKDVAAMANEGGVLLYGIEEEDDGRLRLGPGLENLRGLEERIANAVRDLVHNPPGLHGEPIELDDSSGRGFLVLVVPRSPLAPHMVEGRREGRYYGRQGTTTSRLTGAQVEMLQERRRATRTDANERLGDASRWLVEPPTPEDHRGDFVALVEPTVPAGRLIDVASGEARATWYLAEVFTSALGTLRFQSTEGDAFRNAVREGQWQVGADLYVTRSNYGDWSQANAEVQVGRDGAFQCRRQGAVNFEDRGLGTGPDTWACEYVIGPTLGWMLAAAGRVYGDAGFAGQVRCSVLVSGLFGARSEALYSHRRRAGGLPPTERMVETEYVAHAEMLSLRLATDPITIAGELLADLFEALTQTGYPEAAHPLRLR